MFLARRSEAETSLLLPKDVIVQHRPQPKAATPQQHLAAMAFRPLPTEGCGTLMPFRCRRDASSSKELAGKKGEMNT